MNKAEAWSLFLGGLQADLQRLVATQIKGENLDHAIELMKMAAAYTERPGGSKAEPKKDVKKGTVATVIGDQATTSRGKTQAKVNALLEKKKKEWKKEWKADAKKKARQEREKKGTKGPCFACQGPHRLPECPKWKKLMETASAVGTSTEQGSGNA